MTSHSGARTDLWVIRHDWTVRARRRIVRRGLDLSPLRALRARAGAVWAVGVVRDEADIVAATVANLLVQGVERVVVADNGSTDGTRDILSRFTAVTVVDDRCSAHYQGDKLTLLARAASHAGCEWVVPFDADEIWWAEGGLGHFLADSRLDVVRADVWNYKPRADDPPGADPVRRIQWRTRDAAEDPKWAFRAHRFALVDEGNYRVVRPGARGEGLKVAHFPYRSEEQFVRKVRRGRDALAATDLDEHVGYHWRRLGGATDEELAREWDTFVAGGTLSADAWDVAGELVHDPVVVDGE